MQSSLPGSMTSKLSHRVFQGRSGLLAWNSPLTFRQPVSQHVPLQRSWEILSAASSNNSGSSEIEPGQSGSSGKDLSMMEKVKEWFTGAKEREKLASLGMAAFISYGAVSNATYCTCLTIAWIAFVKQKGLTPLASGQWGPFLAFYAGLWTIQNIFRPARFALAVALAPLWDRLLNAVSARSGLDKKFAFVFIMIIMGLITASCLFLAIYLLGGLPDGIGPFPPLKRF